MAELERVKIIPLVKPLEDTTKKITYPELELKAPTLSQAEQFYEKQAASTSLAAMRLLIALVTDTRESVLQPMDFIDFRKCEEYLLSFLTWKA
ncbi:TPA: phage tail assembly protein [Citrobacter braakii]|uniref:phage tail assembly protein n=1 Tax=Citrobacter braakii TaxID=57706 RepID=UPI0027F3E7F0|nr:phage tail assembly protein [Citrobacter braakii]